MTAVGRILGDAALGTYQYGSAISSGLRPPSDLDILVVTDRPTTAAQRQELVEELLQCSGRQGTRIAGRPVEVTIVRQAAVSPWPAEPEREFQYGEWLRSEYKSGMVPAPAVDQDLAPLLFTALTASRTLAGPPIHQLIEPIPHDELVTAMRAGVPGLLDELAEDTRNVLLTLARIWYTSCTGDITSKDDAAAWAVERIPVEAGAAALEHARSVYLGEQPEAFDQLGEAPVEVARFMTGRIGKTSRRA